MLEEILFPYPCVFMRKIMFYYQEGNNTENIFSAFLHTSHFSTRLVRLGKEAHVAQEHMWPSVLSAQGQACSSDGKTQLRE